MSPFRGDVALTEQTPEEIAEYVDTHILMALNGADLLNGGTHGRARQAAEDYLRDRLVALSDTYPTRIEVAAENARRTSARLIALLSEA